MTIHRAGLFARLISHFEAAPASSLSNLARQARVHRHTADRVFHDATGNSFHVWRDTWRERKALDLLVASPEMSIKEVAVMIGLGGSGALRRLLLRRLGRTPTQIRRDASK